MFAATCVCPCGLVHSCHDTRVSACVFASGPPPVFSVRALGSGPCVKAAQPPAPGELPWGWGLWREASGWLSTPRGCWDGRCFLGELMRMSCKAEPTAALKSRQMTAPSHPSPMKPVTLSPERKLNWSGPVCCSQSRFGRCCVMRYVLLGAV